MVVFDIHIGENQASWERQKFVPESIDDACTFTPSSGADVLHSKPGKASAGWQVCFTGACREDPLVRCLFHHLF